MDKKEYKLTGETQENIGKAERHSTKKPFEIIRKEADQAFTETDKLIKDTESLVDKNQQNEISDKNNNGETGLSRTFQSLKHVETLMFTEDKLDEPTVKDEIWQKLKSIDEVIHKGRRNTNEVIVEAFGFGGVPDAIKSLTFPTEKGEQVRVGDLLAAYDALTLKINNLQENNETHVDPESFERKRGYLKDYLKTIEGLDLSDNASYHRLQKLKNKSSEYYQHGLSPQECSMKFNRLAGRAAVLEVYGGDSGITDLIKTREALQEYPNDEAEFKEKIDQEFFNKEYPTRPSTKVAVTEGHLNNNSLTHPK